MENRCSVPADRWVQVSDALLPGLVSASGSPASPSPSEKHTPTAHRIVTTHLPGQFPSPSRSLLMTLRNTGPHLQKAFMFLLCVAFAQVNLGQDSREKKDEKTKVCVCVCVCVCVHACARAHACRNRESVEEGARSLGRAKQWV